ncbi:MAG: PepSY-associated TM helix domain-containing protein [Isosphaeraceae bacterium]
MRVAAAARWLHIYLSMFGLFAVLFFSVTGITLNHPDWFGVEVERAEEFQGSLDPRWVKPPATEPDTGGPEDAAAGVSRLEVVEHLRNTHHVRGALAAITADETTCVVSFKGPGYAADAFITREDGKYTLTETTRGFVAVINDLHKGRDSGPVWSVLIDVSAVLLTVASLSGLILLFYIKRRRIPGSVTAVVGTIVVLLIAYWLVP